VTTPETARALALIAAEQARIAGMTAENMQRQAVGSSMAYTEQDFLYVAFSLEQLSIEVINQ
jgi:hypothetical protein